jgi:hypothetical protein
MPDNMERVRSELDAAHQRVRAALDARDVDGYLAALRPSLTYREVDGTQIDRSHLARAVQAQFSRAHSIRSRFERQSLEITRHGATEVLRQEIAFVARAFRFLHREWRVTRLGQYDWVRDDSGWRLEAVRVTSEETSSRWYLARSVALAT